MKYALLLAGLWIASLMAIPGECAAVEEAPNPQVVISTDLGDMVVELYPASAPQTVAIFLELASGERPWQDPHSGEMVTRPYYDGTIFHRVIPDFMIQGGDVLGSGRGGAGFTFADEINGKGLGLDNQYVLSDGRLHPDMAYMQPQFMQAIIQPHLAQQGITPQSPQAEVAQAMQEIISKLKNRYTLLQFYGDLGYQYNADLTPREPVAGALCLANRGPNSNSGQFFINLRDTPHLRGKHTVFGQVISGFEVVQAIAAVETNDADRPREAVHIRHIRRLPEGEPQEDD